jgi:hypothetical protein
LAQGEAQGDGCKFAHVLHPDGTIEPIKTWERSSDFVQLEWTSLEDTPAKFIRVTGTATADQAADVISAIAHYRTRSNAYVITNGVKIEGVGGMGDLAEMSFESIKAFDVLAALYELLEPEEAAAIRTLMGDEAPSTASGGASTFELEMMS